MIPNSWRLSRLILYDNFLWYLYGFCLDGKSDQKPMLRTRIWTFSVRSRIWNQIQTLLCLLTRKILPNKYINKKMKYHMHLPFCLNQKLPLKLSKIKIRIKFKIRRGTWVRVLNNKRLPLYRGGRGWRRCSWWWPAHSPGWWRPPRRAPGTRTHSHPGSDLPTVTTK